MLDPRSAPPAPVPPRARPGSTSDTEGTAAPGRTKSAALLAAARTLSDLAWRPAARSRRPSCARL